MVAGALALGAVAAACSSSEPSTATTTTAAPSVDAVVEQAAAAMADVEFVAFDIERSGADVAIDDAGQLVFDAAEGRYAAPASADALLEVRALGLRTRVGAVAIDGEVWITNPVTGRWEAAPPGLSFDPAVLFADDTGWPALLRDGLQDPELVGDGPDGEGRHHVRGTVEGERVATLTGGLVDEPTVVELWLDADSGLVQACRFDVETDEGTSTWSLTLDGYGEAVDIEVPPLGDSG